MSLLAVNSQIIETLTPRDYGDVRAEYEAIRHGAALLDLPLPAVLEISGKNAVQFINGLVTNDVKSLAAGEGILAAFLNVQGKVVSLCRFYQTGEKLVLECDGAQRKTIYKNLGRFVPAGEFFVNDVSEKLNLLSLQGPQSAALLTKIMNQAIEAEPEYRNYSCEINGTKILLTSHFRANGQGFDLFVAREAGYAIRQTLLDAGAQAAGSEALEIARLEAGIPRENVDVTENNILLEAGYEKAVSYTKGCYLGQEVIARIHWRGQPAKQLRGLVIDAEAVPARGTEMWAEDGKKIGEITSAVKSFALNQIIALGYVHRYYLTDGTRFTLKLNEAEIGHATVTATPFVK